MKPVDDLPFRHEVPAWLLGRPSENFPAIGPWRWSARP
jgi:hypothetical protein